MTILAVLHISVSVIMVKRCMTSHILGGDLRLLRTFDTINGGSVRYDYDIFGSLSGAMYGDGSCQWHNIDLMGNVYDSPRPYGQELWSWWTAV